MLLTYFILFFLDDARGLFHPYYTVVMAPAVAALAVGRSRSVATWPTIVAMGMGAADDHRPQRAVGGQIRAVLPRSYGPWLGLTAGIGGVAAAFVLFVTLIGSVAPAWYGVAAGTMAAAASSLAPWHIP